MNKNYFLLSIAISFQLSAALPCDTDKSISNTLEHKNDQIHQYLESLKFNSPEKTELSKYIGASGTYLEIGTGGDPIALMLKQIPEGYAPTIIASDIDRAVLNLLPERHPAIKKYLNSDEITGAPKLKLVQLDATDMSIFGDDSLSGINASAIVHEILSYAGGQSGLEKFFKESFRVLKNGSVLIYRDPEGVTMPSELVKMELKTKIMRLFSHLFLCKFLDMKCTRLFDEKNNVTKVSNYDKNALKFNFYKKGKGSISQLNYEEYLATPTAEIDFDRKFCLELPRQLCREIERHYLTFLHDCNPFVFIKFVPDTKTDQFHVIFLSQRVEKIFADYVKKYHISFSNGKIDSSGKEKLMADMIRRMTHIENGIRIRLSSSKKRQELKDILIKKELNPQLYIQEMENNWVLLDYRVFGLLYRELSQWFDEDNAPFGTVSESAAKWLHLEGEENYFYSSVDALITWVGHITLQESNKAGHKEPLLLCPISAQENKFVPRNHYNELLRDSINITDKLGYEIEIKEGKRIIHFAKMNFEDALKIYTGIIEKDPTNYPMLNTFLESLHDLGHKNISEATQ